jgi:hypothetical protein
MADSTLERTSYQRLAATRRVERRRGFRVRTNFGAYDPTELVCFVHRCFFVQFGNASCGYSHGCPACVELIRNKVRRERGNVTAEPVLFPCLCRAVCRGVKSGRYCKLR